MDCLRSKLAVASVVLLGLQLSPVHAQTAAPPTASLTALVQSGIYAFNGLEIAAAKANDAAYLALVPTCGQAVASCTGSQMQLFDRLRELEDNANQLLGRGETQFSLRAQAQALGFALRWTADEEFSAQGSLTSKFANTQQATLTSRLSALRFVSQTLRLARLERGESDGDSVNDGSSPLLAYYSNGTAHGGGASADSNPFPSSNWGAFANGGYGAGSKSATTFEDAFNFNDTEVSAGTDVRLNRHFVLGFLAGHSDKNVIFNSAESIVNGGIRAAGYSFIVYGQLEGDAAYGNFSIGGQHLDLDTRRSITYPSLNPLIPSVNETSSSNANANSLTAQVGGGYGFHWGGFTAEPYLNAQYVGTHIARFTEHGGNGFDFLVASQSIPSLVGSAGLKFQQAFLPPFGVIVPYVYGEFRREFLDSSRSVDTVYAGAATAVAAGQGFQLPTDQPDRDYFVVGGGLTVVLKHGFQGYAQYIKVLQLQNYSDYVASAGIRYEF